AADGEGGEGPPAPGGGRGTREPEAAVCAAAVDGEHAGGASEDAGTPRPTRLECRRRRAGGVHRIAYRVAGHLGAGVWPVAVRRWLIDTDGGCPVGQPPAAWHDGVRGPHHVVPGEPRAPALSVRPRPARAGEVLADASDRDDPPGMGCDPAGAVR